MRRSLLMLFGMISISGLAAGCRTTPDAPPRVPVPAAGNHDASVSYRTEEVKPLPSQEPPPDNPPYFDVPLVSQQLPEQPAFVDAYHKVGSPRIIVMVDRTNDIDLDAVQSVITDWISCDGQVTILAHQGNAAPTGADIIVQVRAETTKQTAQGNEIRMIAEAVNTRGGESIARAVVDMPPPLEKTTINRYTRFVARKLIDGMLNTWSAPQPAPPPTPASLLPSTQPTQP